MSADVDVLVSEVGPRDGLHSIRPVMPLAAKCAWIAAEAAAGVRTIPDLTVAVLVPNLKGAEAAVAAGVHELTIPLSVSETHSLRNVRRTHAQMLEEVRGIAELLRTLPPGRRPRFEGGLSTAFGCTLEGDVPAGRVVSLAGQLMAAGCDEVGLSDTTGYANPAQVKGLVTRVRAAVGERAFAALHLHNTRRLGLANVLAGLEVGVTTFDSSLGGLGGCPFAPDASGNVVTEDLVFMLEAMGLRTGIDLPRLLEVRRILREALPGEALHGFTPEAGLPLGFRAATPAGAVA